MERKHDRIERKELLRLLPSQGEFLRQQICYLLHEKVITLYLIIITNINLYYMIQYPCISQQSD